MGLRIGKQMTKTEFLALMVEEYYANNAKKIRIVTDRAVAKIVSQPLSEIFREECYSVANEVFTDIVVNERYDLKYGDFYVFIFSCISNKIKTMLTAENRMKRVPKDRTVSLNQSIDEEGDMTYEDIVATESKEDLSDAEEECKGRMEKYYKKLSNTQKKIADLLVDGYNHREIQKILNIDSELYYILFKDMKELGKIKVLKKWVPDSKDESAHYEE